MKLSEITERDPQGLGGFYWQLGVTEDDIPDVAPEGNTARAVFQNGQCSDWILYSHGGLWWKFRTPQTVSDVNNTSSKLDLIINKLATIERTLDELRK